MQGLRCEELPVQYVVSRFTQDRSGATALIFGLLAPVFIAATGAAIAYSQASNVHTAQQNALDTAVLAATGLPLGTTDAARTDAAQKAFNGSLSANTTSAVQSSEATFTVTPIGSDNVKVTGTATAAVKNPFGAFIGGYTIPVGSAAAATKGSGPPVCVYALNNRTNGAVDLNGTVNVTTSCPVQVNSGSGSAVRAVGDARMTTSAFGVSGNFKGNAFSPAPSTGAAQLPDPFTNISFPASGNCVAQSGATIKTGTSLSPGTYCGGLRISSGAVVTLSPGIYIFKDGDFKIDSGAQVTGDEVLLAFDGKGAKFWMTGEP